jgi:hypothetical protein
MKSIAIIHFQPIEKYPPIMNFIHNLEIKNIKSIQKTLDKLSQKKQTT